MSLYTKTGFSKNFGCCSHWKKCNMGRTTCVYEVEDPETMRSCSSWRRNNTTDVTVAPTEITITEIQISMIDEIESNQIVVPTTREQLSLF